MFPEHMCRNMSGPSRPFCSGLQALYLLHFQDWVSLGHSPWSRVGSESARTAFLKLLTVTSSLATPSACAWCSCNRCSRWSLYAQRRAFLLRCMFPEHTGLFSAQDFRLSTSFSCISETGSLGHSPWSRMGSQSAQRASLELLTVTISNLRMV